MKRTEEVTIADTTIEVTYEDYPGSDWVEDSITCDGDISALLRYVASKGWEAYDEILETVEVARQERAVEAAIDRAFDSTL